MWFTTRHRLMGVLTNRASTSVVAVMVVALIVGLNVALVLQVL